MNETEDTARSGDWTVEPPRKTGRGRKALRIALVVVVSCGIIAILGKTYITCKEKADKAYDAYCMEKYKFDAGLATASGWTQCSCGHREEIGYIYVGGPLPKPRPSASEYIVENYNRKLRQIEQLKLNSRGRSHNCPNSGECIQ